MQLFIMLSVEQIWRHNPHGPQHNQRDQVERIGGVEEEGKRLCMRPPPAVVAHEQRQREKRAQRHQHPAARDAGEREAGGIRQLTCAHGKRHPAAIAVCKVHAQAQRDAQPAKAHARCHGAQGQRGKREQGCLRPRAQAVGCNERKQAEQQGKAVLPKISKSNGISERMATSSKRRP